MAEPQDGKGLGPPMWCSWITTWRRGTRIDTPSCNVKEQVNFDHDMPLRLWGLAVTTTTCAAFLGCQFSYFLLTLIFYFHSLWVKTLDPPCIFSYSCLLQFAFNFLFWWLCCLWPAWFLNMSGYLLFPFISQTLLFLLCLHKDGHSSYQETNAGSLA